MNIPYSHKVGFAYEYFVLEKIRKDYDKVWHWKDFPEKLMYENNLINNYEIFSKYRYDIGADLVAYKDNKYYFIQCKNYNDTILMENLAGFYFLLYEYNLSGILYYNGKLSQRVLDLTTNKIQFINLPFNNLTIDIIENIEIPLTIRDYQQDVYNKLYNKKTSILSLPCGMGKTYTTSLIAKHYDNIIILSPLRYLAFQTLEQYKKYLGSEYSPILISLDGKRKLEDINNYIKEKNIISSTYDSVDILIKLISKLKNIYLIIDEFHNLSDNQINDIENNMYKILNYKCDKIFVSATPLKNFMNINDIYQYCWKDAIANKYICDFNIYIPDKNENYQLFVDMINKTCNNNLDEKIIKKAYFMLKSILFNGDKKCICYMTSIEYANSMCNILIWMSKLLGIEIEYWQINYNTKKTIREKIINNFKESIKIAIIINVHILDEGINIPECDSVFITQPSNNITNIIQRMCRANRIIKNKNNCNIYLWCNEKKTDMILDYINDNTQEYIKNKVFIYNTENRIIKKYIIKKMSENNNLYCDINNNILLKDKIIEFVKDNNLLIDNNFINDYFDIYNKENDCTFSINIDIIAKWFKTKKGHIKDTLLYSYKENIDYKIIKGTSNGLKGKPKENILLTPKCFKLIFLRSKTKNAINFQEEYYKLEKIIFKYNNFIVNNLEEKIKILNNI
jgi:superfamily II DNA or RNA helicase